MKNNYSLISYDETNCGEFVSTFNENHVQNFMNYFDKHSLDPVSIQITKDITLTLFPENGKVFINDKISSNRFVLTHVKLFESFLKSIHAQ